MNMIDKGLLGGPMDFLVLTVRVRRDVELRPGAITASRQGLCVTIDLAHLQEGDGSDLGEVVFTHREGVVRVNFISWGELIDTV